MLSSKQTILAITAQNEFLMIWSSLLTVFVMTMGEVNFGDMFLPQSRLTPFRWDANILLMFFLFIMPIVLVNLLVSMVISRCLSYVGLHTGH